MPLTTPELVLFDCDGVLVDSEPVTIQMLLEDFAERGLDLAVEETHKLFVGGTIWGAGNIARDMGADIPENWSAEFYERLFTELAKGVPLIEGVLDIINALEAKGIPTGIVSNGSERKMEITLGPHGLFDRFQGRIFSAHTLGVAKPDPELVLIAARQFGADPAKTVFVDDSPSGCKAGHAAGMVTVGFAKDTDPARLKGVSHHIINRMDDLRELVGL